MFAAFLLFRIHIGIKLPKNRERNRGKKQKNRAQCINKILYRIIIWKLVTLAILQLSTHTVFSMISIISCSQHTVQDGSLQPQGPRPKGICNYIQQLYQDVRNAWQTT
jgi:hypothetical protein